MLLWVRHHMDPLTAMGIRKRSRFAFRFMVELTQKEIDSEREAMKTKGPKQGADPKARLIKG